MTELQHEHSGSNAETSSCIDIARQLGDTVARLQFSSPSHVYNPLQYAWPAHEQYLQRYGMVSGRVLLVGMNPGPWGMAQTGVPFGDVIMARDWLGIEAPLQPPLPEQHSKYPIAGFACTRREGSGRRLWGWAEQRFGTPEQFFERFFVWNYCPLLFIGNGRNLVPGKLKQDERKPLLAACNKALEQLLQLSRPAAVVGIGRWAQSRAREAAGEHYPVSYLHHPSPANPAANRNWPEMAAQALAPWLE
ncbi:MAG TPA: uracil-DNA glycosylase family protein [Salinisphaeraceae bacterium]|nr:uracil-DNA glycosylase family protein [Salinisphaeraceae bacterium]